MNAEDKLWLVCFVGNLRHKCTRIGEGKWCNLSCTACMEQILPASGVGLSSTLLYNTYTSPPSAGEHTRRAQTNTGEQVYTHKEKRWMGVDTHARLAKSRRSTRRAATAALINWSSFLFAG